MVNDVSPGAEVEREDAIGERSFMAGINAKGSLEAGDRSIGIRLKGVALSKLDKALDRHWIDGKRSLAGTPGLGKSPEQRQDVGAAERGSRRFRIQFECAIVTRKRLVETIDPQQGLAAIDPGIDVFRRECKRPIEAEDGLVGPMQLDQRRASVDVGRGKAGIERDRLIVAPDCLGRLAHFAERVAAVVVGTDMLRVYRDRFAETCDGVSEMSQRQQRIAAIVVSIHEGWIDFDRLVR